MTRTAGALRALATLLYGVLPIALLVIGYQLFYVPTQTAYLHSRNHRFLATASEQIVRRLQGFAWALDSAVAECSGRLLENLTECPNANVVERRECCLRHSSLRMNATVQLTAFRPQNGNEALRLATRNGEAKGWWNPGDTPFIFWEYQRNGKATPHVSLDEAKLYARATLADLLGPILRRGADFFDDLYVVTDDGEKILYQQNGNWAHLPEVRAALHRAVVGKPDGAQPADESILAFKQVLQFDRQVSTGRPMSPWHVVGVVAATRLNQQKAMMSPGWVIPILIAVVLLLATYPFIKLSHMGPRERLKPLDAILVVFASGVITGVTTFVLLHYTSNWFSDRTDDNLRQFAEDLQSRFGEELTSAYDQLEGFKQALRTGALDDKPGVAAAKPDAYPYFTQLTLIGSDGNAKRAWKPRLDAEGKYDGVEWCTTPQYPASARPYFRDAQSGEMPELRAGNRTIRVAIEPIVSYTSRQFLLQLALPLSNSARPEVVAMSTRPISLVGPTLPSGFWFAVVKQDGQVLFHSDENRNMQENFFAEVDNGWRFRVATGTKVPDVFSTRYYGWEERARIQPLHGTDWFIVTFHDMRMPYALQWTTLIAWITMFVLYLAVFLAGALLIHLLRPAYRLPWLWPNRQRRYLPALVALLTVAALVAGVVVGGDPIEALLAVALGPLLAFALLYFMLQPNDGRWWLGAAAAAALAMLAMLVASLWHQDAGSGELASAGGLAIIACAVATRTYPECRKRTEFQFRLAYAAVLTAVLVIWSALPSAVLFTDARQELERARIRSLQGAFAGALTAREEHLTAEVQRNAHKPHTRACNRLIDGFKWDVYPPMEAGPQQPGDRHPPFYRAVMAWWNGQGRGMTRHAARPVRQAGGINAVAYHLDGDAAQEDSSPGFPVPVEPGYISEAFIKWLPSYNVYAAELASWTASKPAVYDPSDCPDFQITDVSTPVTPQRGGNRMLWLLAIGCAAGLAFFASVSQTRKLFLLDMVDCTPPSRSLARERQGDKRNQRLWGSLKNPEEKLALIQLATEGFLSPNNVGVANALARQHLVRRTPALEVLDDSFREFVLAAEPAETVANWEHEGGPSNWSRLQAPLVTLCVCIGVFLFTTQRDVFDSTVGWITALTAGLSTAAPPLFRLFAMIMRPTVLTDSRSDGGGTAA